MTRLRVGVVFGGASEEHPVSVRSAREVARHLDVDAYEPSWIGITPAGTWLLCGSPEGDWAASGRPAVLSPDRDVHGLLVHDGTTWEPVRLDVVLPVVHGRLGEDGALQGLLELSGIPYVGSDVQASATCMDKSLTYTVVRAAGIATPDFRVVEPGATVDPAELDYPVFVKPARSGSSFGVSRVASAEDLPAALEAARRFDAKVLVERAVAGDEIGCAVLGDVYGLVASEVDRVVLSHGFFRIHQEDAPETGSENATFEVPADVPESSRRRVQETAKAVYQALGCKGLARVDLFLTGTGEVVLNEVNTLPGLTSYSRFPRMMAATGLSMSEVIDRLVAMTIHGKRR